MTYSSYGLMRVLAAGARRRVLKAKKDIVQRLAKAGGVTQPGCYVALRANIKHAKNSALCLFGELGPRIDKYGGLKRKSRT